MDFSGRRLLVCFPYSVLLGSTVDTLLASEEFLALCWALGDDFRIVSVFCAEFGSTAVTCSASVYVAF